MGPLNYEMILSIITSLLSPLLTPAVKAPILDVSPIKIPPVNFPSRKNNFLILSPSTFSYVSY